MGFTLPKREYKNSYNQDLQKFLNYYLEDMLKSSQEF